MACAVATPLLEPSGDFPAWLEAQGVNAEVARAMDSELGIRDYGVLRACVGDGLVRAELLATARDRLPFGFYAVLRQVVKALQGAEPHDAGTPRWDDAASSPGDVTLGGLVDVLLALFSGLSRELLLSAQKLGDMDKNGTCAVGSPSATGAETPLDNEIHEMNDYAVNDEGGENSSPDKDDMEPHHTFFPVKSEVDKGRDNSEGHSGFIIEDAFLCKEVGLDVMNVVKVSQIEEQTESHAEVEDKSTVHVTRFIKATEHIPERVEALSINDRLPNDGQNIFEDNTPLEQQQQQPFSKNTSPPIFLTANVNSGAEKKPYQCSVCNKSFTWNSHLVEHQRIHTGEKPYRCKTCDQSFVQSCHLKTHMRTHTGEKPYLCTTCTRSFSRSHHLKAHQRMHTGQRPFQCKICNHSFSRTGMLKAHERSHTGERPYRCKMCDSSFLRSHHLQVHERTHTGFRPYQCKVCSSSFMRSHHLKVHERMHVGNDSQQ